MQFGKPENPDTIDFTLPPDPPINGRSIVSNTLPIQLYTGGTGWGMKDWKGKLYPPKAPVKSFLTHYGTQFRTVELNSLFYNIPKDETILNWCSAVPDDFKFCPKVLQYISHSKTLGLETDRLERFQHAISLFGDKLGPSFMQLPPYFDTTKFPLLANFIEQFGRELPLAIEFRHPSWFDNSAALNKVAELLHDFKKGMVITDVGGRRDVCHMSITTDYAFVRFVGNNLHKSDYNRTENWISRLNKWFDQGLQNVYFFIHEPDNIYAPELSSFLHENLIPRSNLITRGPKLIREEDQMTLF